jgi:hypothetical protein
MRERVKPRNESYARGVVKWVSLSPKFMAEIGRLGAISRVANSTKTQRRKWARAAIEARFANSTPRQRSAWARKAVIARWRKE